MSNDTFLKACRREPVSHTPVWLMRQAGRYMKEYRDLKEKHTFLEMCRTPELACEVTLQPIKAFELDAAIIFADILLPLEGMGINLEFAKDMGPVISNPVRTAKDIEDIRIIEPEQDVPFLMEGIKLVQGELNGKVPLIGFSGAPFTLASYIIEGGGSRNYVHAKGLMYREPKLWHILMDKVTEVIKRYLAAQVEAGVQAVQIFDSWVGCLGPQEYKEFVLPYTRRVIDSVTEVPVINFSTNTSSYLDTIRAAGGDVISVDWRIPLDKAWNIIGHDVGIQGNIDPVILFSSIPEIRKRAKEIIERAGGRPGHIFNLGHGIIVETPVDHVRALIDCVHEFTQK